MVGSRQFFSAYTVCPLLERKKDRKIEELAIFYTAGSGIPECFHGCVGAY